MPCEFDINITLSDAALGSTVSPTVSSSQPSGASGASDDFDLDLRYLDSTQSGESWPIAVNAADEAMAAGSGFFGITCSNTCAVAVGGGNTCAATCSNTCAVVFGGGNTCAATCSNTCAVVFGGGNTCSWTCSNTCARTFMCITTPCGAGGQTGGTCACPFY